MSPDRYPLLLVPLLLELVEVMPESQSRPLRYPTGLVEWMLLEAVPVRSCIEGREGERMNG